MRCEARTLDDIRALGGNDAADERRFATAARVSEINLALYRTFAQPVVRALVSAPVAEIDAAAAPAAAAIRDVLQRKSVDGGGRGEWPKRCARTEDLSAADNPFVALQESVSKQIVAALDAWRDFIEDVCGADFPGGLRLAGPAGRGRHRSRRHAAAAQGRRRIALHQELVQKRIAELKSRIPVGGLREAIDPRPPLRRHGAGCGRRARL